MYQTNERTLKPLVTERGARLDTKQHLSPCDQRWARRYNYDEIVCNSIYLSDTVPNKHDLSQVIH